MSARLYINKPVMRKSSLALHKINVTRKGSASGSPSRSRSATGNGSCNSSNGSSNSGSATSTDCEIFDSLRAVVKEGEDFNKELVAILNEKIQLESTYARGLIKLSAKLFRACESVSSSSPDIVAPMAPNSVIEAWRVIAEDIRSEAEVHRNVSSLLEDNLVRPLKTFADSQYKTRKAVETSLDKRARSLAELRSAEAKTKVRMYDSTRANERVQDVLLDCKLGRGRVLSEKELVKLESKRKKSGELAKKSDLDYYSTCIRAERSRLEWESGLLKGSSLFRRMEHDRLRHLQSLAEQYLGVMMENRPQLVASCRRIGAPIRACQVIWDMENLEKRVQQPMEKELALAEQLLPSFYAEDRTNAMNQERRREALARALKMIRSDIDRELKGKAGVENLAKALAETPKFGNQDTQQDVNEKLLHMKSMLTFLEATRYKVLNTLLELEGRPRVFHRLGDHIENDRRDKQGMQAAVLRLALSSRLEAQPEVEYHDDWGQKADEDIDIDDELFAYHSGAGNGVKVPTAVRHHLVRRGLGDGGATATSNTGGLASTLTAVVHPHHPHQLHRGPADGVNEDSDFDDFSDPGDLNGSNPAEGNNNCRGSTSSGQRNLEDPSHGCPKRPTTATSSTSNAKNTNTSNTKNSSNSKGIIPTEDHLDVPETDELGDGPSGGPGGAKAEGQVSGSERPPVGPASSSRGRPCSSPPAPGTATLGRAEAAGFGFGGAAGHHPWAVGREEHGWTTTTEGGQQTAENEINEISYRATTTTFCRVNSKASVPGLIPAGAEVPAVGASSKKHVYSCCSSSGSSSSSASASSTRRSSPAPGFDLPRGEDITPSVGQCRAMYDYNANMYDELTIRVGDVINIHDKQTDGWWLGELRGTVGIFPATYVLEDESTA